MDNLKKIKRIGNVLSILSKYGFDDVIARTNVEKYLPGGILRSKRAEKIFSLSMYERLRLALEELGPTYVKFGQTFSNREDIFPSELITELAKLQDSVPPELLDPYQKIADELMIDPADYFEYISTSPIASASISQVYEGKLLDGSRVVIKIKRSGIDRIILSDILIMKDLAALLENNYEMAKRMNLKQIINSFESSVIKELSLINELQNIERFRANFEDFEDIYVPATYKELSNNTILCMEFINGFKINDKVQLEALKMDPSEVAQTGLNSFLKQILEDGFFHADPHPGNVFMMYDKRIAYIDFGAMGQMMPSEMEQLEDLIVNFVLKDARRVIKNIKRLAISYEIKDERALEREIYEIFTILNSSALKEVNAGTILNRLKSILANNNVLMPEYIYLLMRGVSLIEGIGKQLNPDMNITDSIKPYAAKLAQNRLAPKKLLKKGLNNMRILAEGFQNLPEDATLLLEKVKDDKLIINHHVFEMEAMRKTVKNATNRLTYAIIIAALSIGSSILMMAEIPPLLFGNSVLGLLGFLISGILGILIIFSIWQKDK